MNRQVAEARLVTYKHLYFLLKKRLILLQRCFFRSLIALCCHYTVSEDFKVGIGFRYHARIQQPIVDERNNQYRHRKYRYNRDQHFYFEAHLFASHNRKIIQNEPQQKCNK